MTTPDDDNAGAGQKTLFLTLNSPPRPLLGATYAGRMRPPPKSFPTPRWGLQSPTLLSTPGFIN